MFHCFRLAGVPMLATAAGAVLVVTGAPAAAQSDDLDRWTPVDAADYQIPDAPGRGTVYFETPDGRHCAIFSNSGGAGCAAVPIDAPPGTNVIRVSVMSPAEYVTSDPQIYTHPEAEVLPEGHKIEWDASVCGVGFQGTVTCEVSGEHGFTVAATYGVLY